jgi:small multidrug resistance family-3 protein
MAGCFSCWAWVRTRKSPIWLIPGVASPIASALALTRIDVPAAGRADAPYGGV